jgi:uncharacterized protein (DUF362 family)/Pyruvate/2-oxoacid:ferredoxin oxidoreductase delta subunit
MQPQQSRGSQPARVLARSADYRPASLDRTIEEIVEAFPRAWQGKRVLVKPNILAPHRPDRAVTTHPEVVAAVVRALTRRGAEVLVGDNPGVGGYGRSQSSADRCGILDAAGQCYRNLGQQPVQVSCQSRFFDSVTVSREVLEADEVVNLPKLKTHSLTFLTASIKNTFGYLVGGDKMRLHSLCPRPNQFAEALLDVYAIRPPSLTIMDAVLGMQGNGPANGSPVSLGRILGSDDGVALDAAATKFLGSKPSAVPHVEQAGKRGLGEARLERIAIDGDLRPVSGFRFPSTFVPGLTGVLLNRYLSRWINCLPEIDHQRCIECGLCASHCPSGAMRMEEQGPRLDASACINCYCCQEMCPADAIRLTGRLLRFLRRE